MEKTAWEDLTISNDFLFSKLMRDPEICKEIIEVLLEIEIEKIVYIEEEKTIKIGYDAKSVRLDVYVKGDEKIYNLEMQVINYKNLPKRSRYYQSMIDLNSLEKGHNYKELPESYVIFICTFDPFKEGLPRYLFENVCRQKSGLKLGDQTYKMFFNTTSYELEQNPNIKAFLKYVNGEKTENSFIGKIDEKIQTVKENREWRVEYMTLLMREQELVEAERKEVTKEVTKEALRNICESLGLSLQQAMDVLKIPENERSEYTRL